MLTVFVRSVLLFVFAVLAMRVMGKRQVGQLQPFEMVVVIMIAELAATPMGGVGVPLLYGLVPMAALVACHGLISWGCMKSRRFRVWMSGEPTVLVRHGAICEQALRKMSLTLDDLTEALRTAGIPDIGQVDTAVLETGGQITVFPKAAARPVTCGDLQLTLGREGLPVSLIVDGEVQRHNLARLGLDEAWLARQAHLLGAGSAQEVLFLCRSEGGEVLAQRRGEEQMRRIAPEEAK